MHITHLVLQRGHLWWRRELAVPAAKIARVTTDVVGFELSSEQLKPLPFRNRSANSPLSLGLTLFG